MSENSSELINEYKEQIRILRQEVAELQDAGKSKDSALKRTLQKLEYVTEDLDKANKELEAINDAKQKGETAAQEEMKSVTGGLPLPPGMKLPF